MANSLVIYFSRSGENYFGGELKNIEKGNTEVIAEYIKDLDGADLFKVEPANEYPADYMKCIDVAKKEQQDDARPEIKKGLPIPGANVYDAKDSVAHWVDE